MRKLRKVVSLALASALMVTSLVACGGGNDAKKSEGGDTFKIGAIGPITGPAAIYGNAVKNGAEMAVNEINEAGGINGVKIEYNFQDDEHDAEKAQSAYRTLKDWGMQLLLGTTTSVPCIAVAELTNEDNLFQLTPSGTAVECIKNDNAFRVCFSDPNQGAVSAQYIADHKIAKKIAVIYDNSDTYSTGIYQTFAAKAKELGLEIVSTTAFAAGSSPDFSNGLQDAKFKKAELVFMPFYYQEASVVLKQADSMNFKPIFFGVDGMDGILGVENFDVALANDLMFLAPFCSTSEDETIKTFTTSYKDTYGEIPNQFAADAYDGIYIMKQAMEAGNVTPDMSASEICDIVKAQMAEITFAGVTSKEITWEADGEPQKAPQVIQIKDGVYTELK